MARRRPTKPDANAIIVPSADALTIQAASVLLIIEEAGSDGILIDEAAMVGDQHHMTTAGLIGSLQRQGLISDHRSRGLFRDYTPAVRCLWEPAWVLTNSGAAAARMVRIGRNLPQIEEMTPTRFRLAQLRKSA